MGNARGDIDMDINRRDFLRRGSAAVFGLVAGLLKCERAGAIDYTKPVPEAKGLTAYLNGANVIVRLSRQAQGPRRPCRGHRGNDASG